MIQQPKRRRTWAEIGSIALFFLLFALFIAMLAFTNMATGAELGVVAPVSVHKRTQEVCGIDAKGYGYLKGSLAECIEAMQTVIRLTAGERDVARAQARGCEKRAK